MVVEAKEESKDDKGNVSKPEGREEFLGNADGGHKLANTENETPPLARAELTKEAEGELSKNRAGVNGGTKGNEAAEFVSNLRADTRAEREVHTTAALTVTNVGKLGATGSGGNVVDNILKIKGELLETPSPISWIEASVLDVLGAEVGSNVGHPDIETLVDKPEGH